MRESWSADKTALDMVQICQEGKEKTSSNQGSRTKSGLHADQLITDKAKGDTNSAIISGKAHLWEQNHRSVGWEPHEILELHPTLHKILELHWCTRVGRGEFHQRLRQSRNSKLFLLLSPDRGTPTRLIYTRYTNHKPDPHFERHNHHCRRHLQETSQALGKQSV